MSEKKIKKKKKCHGKKRKQTLGVDRDTESGDSETLEEADSRCDCGDWGPNA